MQCFCYTSLVVGQHSSYSLFKSISNKDKEIALIAVPWYALSGHGTHCTNEKGQEDRIVGCEHSSRKIFFYYIHLATHLQDHSKSTINNQRPTITNDLQENRELSKPISGNSSNKARGTLPLWYLITSFAPLNNKPCLILLKWHFKKMSYL